MSLYGVRVVAWGAEEGKTHGIKHTADFKLFGGSTGHAAFNITFPVNEETTALIKQYCGRPPLPVEKIKIQVPKAVQDAQGQWIQSDTLTMDQEVYVVAGSWWPGVGGHVMSPSIQSDALIEREGAHRVWDPERLAFHEFDTESRMYGKGRHRHQKTFGTTGITHQRHFDEDAIQLQYMNLKTQLQMTKARGNSLELLEEKLEKKLKTLREADAKRAQIDANRESLKQSSADIKILEKYYAKLKANKPFDLKTLDKEAQQRLDKLLASLSKTQDTDAEQPKSIKLDAIRGLIKSKKTDCKSSKKLYQKGMQDLNHIEKNYYLSDTEIILLDRFLGKWREIINHQAGEPLSLDAYKGLIREIKQLKDRNQQAIDEVKEKKEELKKELEPKSFEKLLKESGDLREQWLYNDMYEQLNGMRIRLIGIKQKNRRLQERKKIDLDIQQGLIDKFSSTLKTLASSYGQKIKEKGADSVKARLSKKFIEEMKLFTELTGEDWTAFAEKTKEEYKLSVSNLEKMLQRVQEYQVSEEVLEQPTQALLNDWMQLTGKDWKTLVKSKPEGEYKFSDDQIDELIDVLEPYLIKQETLGELMAFVGVGDPKYLADLNDSCDMGDIEEILKDYCELMGLDYDMTFKDKEVLSKSEILQMINKLQNHITLAEEKKPDLQKNALRHRAAYEAKNGVLERRHRTFEEMVQAICEPAILKELDELSTYFNDTYLQVDETPDPIVLSEHSALLEKLQAFKELTGIDWHDSDTGNQITLDKLDELDNVLYDYLRKKDLLKQMYKRLDPNYIQYVEKGSTLSIFAIEHDVEVQVHELLEAYCEITDQKMDDRFKGVFELSKNDLMKLIDELHEFELPLEISKPEMKDQALSLRQKLYDDILYPNKHYKKVKELEIKIEYLNDPLKAIDVILRHHQQHGRLIESDYWRYEKKVKDRLIKDLKFAFDEVGDSDALMKQFFGNKVPDLSNVARHDFFKVIDIDTLGQLQSFLAEELEKAHQQYMDIMPSHTALDAQDMESFMTMGEPPDVEHFLPLDQDSVGETGVEHGMNLEAMLKRMHEFTKEQQFDLNLTNCSVFTGSILEAGAKTPYLKSHFSQRVFGSIATPQQVANAARRFQADCRTSPQDNLLKRLYRWRPVQSRLGKQLNVYLSPTATIRQKRAAILKAIPLGLASLAGAGFRALLSPVSSLKDALGFIRFARNTPSPLFRTIGSMVGALGVIITMPLAFVSTIIKAPAQVIRSINAALKRKKIKKIEKHPVDISKDELKKRVDKDHALKSLLETDRMSIKDRIKIIKEDNPNTALQRYKQEYDQGNIPHVEPKTLRRIEAKINAQTDLKVKNELNGQFKEYIHKCLQRIRQMSQGIEVLEGDTLPVLVLPDISKPVSLKEKHTTQVYKEFKSKGRHESPVQVMAFNTLLSKTSEEMISDFKYHKKINSTSPKRRLKNSGYRNQFVQNGKGYLSQADVIIDEISELKMHLRQSDLTNYKKGLILLCKLEEISHRLNKNTSSASQKALIKMLEEYSAVIVNDPLGGVKPASEVTESALRDYETLQKKSNPSSSRP